MIFPLRVVIPNTAQWCSDLNDVDLSMIVSQVRIDRIARGSKCMNREGLINEYVILKLAFN